MKKFILGESVSASQFESCVNLLRLLEYRQIESYVTIDFPCFNLFGAKGIKSLGGSLKTWNDVAKSNWHKESVVDYEPGDKSFCLVLPSGINQFVTEISIHIDTDEGCLQALGWWKENQSYLAINFLPE